MQTLRDVKGCDGFKWNSGNPCGHQMAASMKLYPTDVNWKTEHDDNDDLQKTTEGTSDTPVSSEQATDSTEGRRFNLEIWTLDYCNYLRNRV